MNRKLYWRPSKLSPGRRRERVHEWYEHENAPVAPNYIRGTRESVKGGKGGKRERRHFRHKKKHKKATNKSERFLELERGATAVQQRNSAQQIP